MSTDTNTNTTDTNTHRAPSPGTRWGLVAPAGAWTPEVRAIHAAEIARSALRRPNSVAWYEERGVTCPSILEMGPWRAPGLPCAMVTGRWEDEVADLTGPATTWGGRPLHTEPDGSVWAEVARNRPSGIELGVVMEAPDLPGVPDDPRDLRAVPLTGAVWLVTWREGGWRTSHQRHLLTSPGGVITSQRAHQPDIAGALARYGLAPHEGVQ